MDAKIHELSYEKQNLYHIKLSSLRYLLIIKGKIITTAKKPGRQHLNLIQVNITQNNTYWHHVPSDMMHLK